MDKELSLLEVACELMKSKKNPQPIYDIVREALEMTGKISSDNVYEDMKQLYSDITTSGNFIYCKDDLWDLKDRQSLELWDKDGAYFYHGVVEEDDFDDGITVDDYNLDDKPSKEEDEEFEDYYEEEPLVTENVDEDIAITDIIDEDDEDMFILDEEATDDEFIDEETYNEYMDDYEDMYDEE